MYTNRGHLTSYNSLSNNRNKNEIYVNFKAIYEIRVVVSRISPMFFTLLDQIHFQKRAKPYIADRIRTVRLVENKG